MSLASVLLGLAVLADARALAHAGAPAEGAGGAVAAPSPAPRCELRGEPWLEGQVDGGPAGPGVDARRGETIEVAIVAPGRLDGAAVIFSGRPGRGRTSWTEAGCPPLSIRWRRIDPRMEHVETPPPNPGLAIYANAVVFGPSHGAWLGHDRVEYSERPLAAGDDRWRLAVRDARPDDPAQVAARDPADLDLGTARLAATLSPREGPARATPGLAEGRLDDRVFRYSVRGGDDLVGWLTAYFGVPYVFGSAGVGARSQAERFIGTDCADLIVAGLRRAGRRDLAYSSVGGLVRSLSRVAGPFEVRPGGAAEPAYSPRPGDILALGYQGAAELPRAWDHIVVLVDDRGPDGVADGALGPEDRVVDIGDGRGLKFAPLGDQGSVRVMVLRADMSAGRSARKRTRPASGEGEP